MGFLRSLFIATILLGLTDGQSEVAESFRTKKYCGSHLSQALSAICKGNYNTLYRNTYQSSWSPQSETYPFQSRSQASSIMNNYRRRRRQNRGVYNECCEKSCSLDELSQYCAQPFVPGRR